MFAKLADSRDLVRVNKDLKEISSGTVQLERRNERRRRGRKRERRGSSRFRRARRFRGREVGGLGRNERVKHEGLRA